MTTCFPDVSESLTGWEANVPCSDQNGLRENPQQGLLGAESLSQKTDVTGPAFSSFLHALTVEVYVMFGVTSQTMSTKSPCSPAMGAGAEKLKESGSWMGTVPTYGVLVI